MPGFTNAGLSLRHRTHHWIVGISNLCSYHGNLCKDQLGQEGGNGGAQGAHRVGEVGLVRGRRHDPHLQHFKTCARCLEVGGETAMQLSSSQFCT